MKKIVNIPKFFVSLILAVIICTITFNTVKKEEQLAKENSLIKEAFVVEEMGENNIIPKPLRYEKGEGEFVLTKDSTIYISGNNEDELYELQWIAELLQEQLKKPTGYEFNIIKGDDPISGSIYLTTLNSNEGQGIEGYKLTSTPNMVEIVAFKPEGIARGIQTLRQMLPSEIYDSEVVSGIEWTMASAIINDKPEYEYRGVMIDVARHFFSADEVKRQIDIASQYKINRVHLHLSDDQGWRLEIKKYPELTEIGGKTEVGGGKGGYYTQEEFKDIVKYAMQRYVEIIPEFDMPGHCNAALASLGFLNPNGERVEPYTGIKVGFSTLMTNNEKTYEFIDNVFKEVVQISPSKYIHIGGDEADSTTKEDYNYFVSRVSKIAEKYNKIPIGWDPIDTAPGITSSVVLQNWKDSNEAAREKEMKMIISIAEKAYLDMKYDESTPYGLDWAGYIPVKVAYDWDPTDFAPRNLVLGLEAPLWTETIATVDQMDYMIYPRLIGYAEIGWTPKENRNWDEYRVRLEKQEKVLKAENIDFFNEDMK